MPFDPPVTSAHFPLRLSSTGSSCFAPGGFNLAIEPASTFAVILASIVQEYSKPDKRMAAENAFIYL